jgi:IS605 OrfB family transposase
MQRAILLQTEATDSKNRMLSDFLIKATEETNRILPLRAEHKKFASFWHATGPSIKGSAGFNFQVVCDLVRGTWRKEKGCSSVDGVTVKFNVPRNCKTFKTKGFTFVELGLYPRKRMAIPIRTNRNWDRFRGLLGSGWICKTYGLTPSLDLVAFLSKEAKELPQRKNILGIDVNSKCFALTILSPKGKVRSQAYLGQGIWERRRRIFERKSGLRALADRGSRSSKRKLEHTRHDEHNFVKNKIGEVVRDITIFALRYDADIAIEGLKRFSPKSRRFNRQVMRIPFYAFRMNLESRCFDKGIELNTVDPWHTSRWCSHCGAIGKGHNAKVYALFRCKECGQVVNADRKASLAIAAKSLLERGSSPNQMTFLSLSSRRVPVNGLLRRPHETGGQMAVPPSTSGGKPMCPGHG